MEDRGEYVSSKAGFGHRFVFHVQPAIPNEPVRVGKRGNIHEGRIPPGLHHGLDLTADAAPERGISFFCIWFEFLKRSPSWLGS